MESRKLLIVVIVAISVLVLFRTFSFNWHGSFFPGWNWHFDSFRIGWPGGMGKLILIAGIVWYLVRRSEKKKAEEAS